MIMDKEISEIIIFSKFCADLTNADKQFKSVKLANEVIVSIEANDTKKASNLMEQLLEHLTKIHWTWTRESLTIDRLINSAIHKTT